MLFKEMLDEGKAEDIIDLLSDLGMVPDELREKNLEEKSLNILRVYLRKAAVAKSVKEYDNICSI